MTLTREEILAMEPGNELDIEIAVTVMGRERDKFRSGWIRLGDLSTYPKQYSKDISAAWEVLEKFKQYSVMKAAGWGKEYDCRIWVGITGDQWSVQAKTASEAICKAALLAVLKL